MTENAVIINGVMTKISEDVIFTYDRNDFMKPWTVKSKFSHHVQLTFTPFFERVAQTNVKVIASSVHQMVGYFNGDIELENGEILHIQQMLGCIEEHVAKW